jgi:hypothetical protein
MMHRDASLNSYYFLLTFLRATTPAALQRYREVKRPSADVPWPPRYDKTTHVARLGDARNLDWIPNEGVHLIVTSPPY